MTLRMRLPALNDVFGALALASTVVGATLPPADLMQPATPQPAELQIAQQNMNAAKWLDHERRRQIAEAQSDYALENLNIKQIMRSAPGNGPHYVVHYPRMV